MKKFMILMLCAVLVSNNAFSLPVAAAEASDERIYEGTTIRNRCSTRELVMGYYAGTEDNNEQKRDLKIDVSYGVVGFGRINESTGEIHDFYTAIAEDSIPVEYIYSYHYVDGKAGRLASDTRS